MVDMVAWLVYAFILTQLTSPTHGKHLCQCQPSSRNVRMPKPKMETATIKSVSRTSQVATGRQPEINVIEIYCLHKDSDEVKETKSRSMQRYQQPFRGSHRSEKRGSRST